MDALQVKNENELVELEGIKITRGQIELIKRTVFKDATDDEMRLFFYECRRRGVHPLDRLIYPVKRAGKVAFQMGIDYLRAAGEETGRYVGQKPMQYGAPIKQIIKGQEINVPEWAEAIILRKDPESGEVVEIPHKVYWKEYFPGEEMGFMWIKMPMNQLGKCAEAGAMRKAFPRKLGGLYINEEMEQAEAVPFTSLMEPQKKTFPSPSEPSPLPSATIALDSVEVKTGKGPKGTWTLYIVHAGSNQYNTFSETFGKLAQHSIDEKINAVISWSETEKGKKLESISLEEVPGNGENAQ